MIPFAIPSGSAGSVEFVAAGAVGATDTGTLPVGWAADETAIFVIVSQKASATTPSHATPAGWTLIGTSTGTATITSQRARLSVYRRKLVALDTNPQAVATNADESQTGIVTYRRVNTATPVEASVATTSQSPASLATSDTPSYLNHVTTGPNRMLVQILGGPVVNGPIDDGTPGFYWTERLEGTGALNSYFRIDDRRVYGSGTHPPVTHPTAATPGNVPVWVKVAFALIPV
jgi:hypothetical protein